MVWQLGRAEVDRLLDERRLERVSANEEHGRRLLNAARSALQVARLATEIDPASTLEVAYTAARKACTALLAVQGLRPTKDGGHLAVQETVEAQFGGPGSSFAGYRRLRRRRNDSEYPSEDTPPMSDVEAREALESAEAIVRDAGRLLESGALSPFG